MGIRNSAKAVIVVDNQLLVIKKQDKDGYYYILPGGGQEHEENLHQALKRECIEEVNAHVEVGNLIFIREYIGRNHRHPHFDLDLHQTEFMFLCKLEQGTHNVRNGTEPDSGQIGVDWLPLSELLQIRMYPKALRKYLINHFAGVKQPVYIGDVN